MEKACVSFLKQRKHEAAKKKFKKNVAIPSYLAIVTAHSSNELGLRENTTRVLPIHCHLDAKFGIVSC